jgi:hypothetical protein
MPFMMIHTKDINQFYSEMQIIVISCEEVIEKQIIPELSLIYTITINQYHDFVTYISLLESIIKSAAIVQQLREIKNYLQIENPSYELIEAIHRLKNQIHFEKKYNAIFDLYYHDQLEINTYLTTSKSLFNPRTYIVDLEYIIGLARKGMMYTTDIAHYELPATYYCYTKNFNAVLSVFLQNIIDDTFDQYNRKLYDKYSSAAISKEAFSSIIITLAFRLQLAIRFIGSFYLNQQMIEENNSENMTPEVDHYFLQFLGEVRSKMV